MVSGFRSRSERTGFEGRSGLDEEGWFLDALVLAFGTPRRPVEEVVEVREPALGALRRGDEEFLVAAVDALRDVLDVAECRAGGHFELGRERARGRGLAAESVGHALAGRRFGLAHTSPWTASDKRLVAGERARVWIDGASSVRSLEWAWERSRGVSTRSRRTERIRLRDRLDLAATASGYSSHALGSRNLDGARAFDAGDDGRVELVVPTDDRQSLAVVARTADGARETARHPLDGRLAGNLATATVDDRTAVGAITTDDRLRIWPA